MILQRIRRMTGTTLTGLLMMSLFAQSEAQPEQRIDVSIKDFTFLTKQVPLRLGIPTVIIVKNEDPERHDFGSPMFEGIPTKIETDGISSYGKGLVWRRTKNPSPRGCG